jgi:predicted alpha-1,6-mannanase (GH76 family)
MKLSSKILACLLVWFVYLGTSICASALTTNDANTLFNSYSNVFYSLSGNNAYFKNNQSGGVTTFWEQAEEIECVIDAYEWTSNATYKVMITNLLNGFEDDHGSSWTTGLFADGYNDDIMWAVLAFARGGQDVGRPDFCSTAKANFDACYARAWDTNLGGGLYEKYPDNASKNACVNGPGAIAAYLLYQIYGDTSYWNKATNIYYWERSVLYDGAGTVYDRISTDGTVTKGSTTYNQGTFIGAANFLGQTNDAILTANHTMTSMGTGGILPNYYNSTNDNNSGFNAIFIRWMTRFVNDQGLQSTYQPWLLQNANAAWTVKRTSDNLSWCNWFQATPAVTNFYSWDCISSVEAVMSGSTTPSTAPGPATVTNDLPLEITLVSGKSYTYSIGVVSTAPCVYQWYKVTTPVAGQTNSTYAVTAGSPGSTTYYVVITNIYGATTSSVSTFTSIAPLMNTYSTNILQFNPVGYWPMHEVEAPAHGDIETNYGSLGALGTGYYSDWEGGAGSSIIHNFPGALANDSDPAVFFAYTGAASSGTTTNCLVIPHTSPLSTLNAPFTVECWFHPTNSLSGDIWGQADVTGLNGATNLFGIRLLWGGSSFSMYTYNGVSGTFAASPSTGSYATNQWHHLVLTDNGTTILLYVDGALPASGYSITVTNKYAPSTWSPLTITTGKGFTRNTRGIIDEFAVYTNVITDIATHYSDGISGAAGVYYSAVTNDKPVIYLRMDSPTYTLPNVSTWPMLTNYGSAGVDGVYNPGTMPGIVAGPANTNGVPFIGLSGTNVAQFSGVSSFADAGNMPACNPTGAVPFTVTAMFRGNPTDDRIQTIVGHSANSWRIAMTTSGTLQCTLGTNSGSAVTSVGVYNDGKWHQVVAVYTPASVPTVTGTNALYVDGVLDTSVSTVSTNGIGPGSAMDMMIGADPQYTNTPAGVGQQFAGQVCEVAIFTNALTATQIQAIYNEAILPTISVTGSGNNVTITYAVTLLSSTNATGPYQPVPGATNSPYTTPATNAQQFYRSSSP